MSDTRVDFARLRPCPSDLASLWLADLDDLRDLEPQLRDTLSAEEADRASRYRLPRDRDRFVVRRGVLRALLGQALPAGPGSLRFDCSAEGKPSLAGPGSALRFSVSHSSGLALIAITRGLDVGVDIEAERPVPEADVIASRFFSTRERAVLSSLPPHERDRAFFEVWTRKEAFVKAIGRGLAFPVRDLDVWIAPGETSRATTSCGGSSPPAAWRVTSLMVAPGWSAALVVQDEDASPGASFR